LRAHYNPDIFAANNTDNHRTNMNNKNNPFTNYPTYEMILERPSLEAIRQEARKETING
jgi:hypothetical protein